MRALANGLLWAGAAVALVASGQSWWTAGSSTETGSTATSGASMVLVLAAAAGAFLGIWLRPTTRRIVTVLVSLLLAGGVLIALGATAPGTLTGSTLNNVAVTATPWRWVYLAAAALAAVGAVLLLFARPGGTRPAATPDPVLNLWKSLDAGEDPTVSLERGVGGDAARDEQQ